MKLVLLPGMDGTGELFDPLLRRLEVATSVVPLPQRGEQDYDTLSDHVLGQLPEGEFVLLAESFSGPLAARIVQRGPSTLRGVIFVATFLTTPAVASVKVASLLPLKRLARLPLASLLIRHLLLGREVDRNLLAQFMSVLDRVPDGVIRARIKTVGELTAQPLHSALPALYIRALGDRLVVPDKVSEFAEAFCDLTLAELNGPHFILQSQPQACADLIIRFLHRLASNTESPSVPC